jgi:hypothetical protein
MAIQLFIQDPDTSHDKLPAYYATGIAGASCLLWVRQADQWTCEPSSLPQGMTTVPMEEVPVDLQEEILALAARADVIGPQGWNLNSG